MSKVKTAAKGAAKTTVIDEAFVEKLGNISQDEMLYDFAKGQVRTFVDALKEGKLPFQPREGTKDNSYCDTYAARNVIWDKNYHGINQLLLKVHQRENGYKTGDYLTKEMAEEAYKFFGQNRGVSMDGVELLKKDAVPVVILTPDKGIPRFQKLYNIDSFGDSQAIWQYGVHKRKQEQENIKKKLEAEGKTYYPPKQKTHDNGVVVCKSTDPVKFIGQWEAACATGKGFKVTPEQNEAFVSACNEFISKPLEGGVQNSSYNLIKLMDASSKYCKEFIPTLFAKKEAPAQTMAVQEPEIER
jgi:hypothetical protein